MNELRFALLGAGFWARYQLAAWQTLPGARCVAVCDPAPGRAEALAQARGVPAAYTDPEALIARESLDFVDVVTPVETHAPLVRLAAAHNLSVICQKPMATTLAEATEMVETCRNAGVPFFVHENWRWQAPLRAVKAALDRGEIGRPFRARLQFSCSFPVFDNQPFLATLEQFLLTDIGSHVLDVARWLFGEAKTVYAQTRRVHPDIRGEDVATVILDMGATTVLCEMSYASRLERERFPETFAVIEGERGSIELGPDYWMRVTTENETRLRRIVPPRYVWADPAYDLIQGSMVPCCADLLHALQSETLPETHAGDNLETVRLVFAAYESARTGQVVPLASEENT